MDAQTYKELLRRPWNELPTEIREQGVRDAKRIFFWVPFLLTLYPAYYISGVLGDFLEEYIGSFGAASVSLFTCLGLCYAAKEMSTQRRGGDHARLDQRAV